MPNEKSKREKGKKKKIHQNQNQKNRKASQCLLMYLNVTVVDPRICKTKYLLSTVLDSDLTTRPPKPHPCPLAFAQTIPLVLSPSHMSFVTHEHVLVSSLGLIPSRIQNPKPAQFRSLHACTVRTRVGKSPCFCVTTASEKLAQR